ncbi:MAG: hypothetical protein ACPLX8_02170 [Nanopusillaceae archaeon]
MITFEGTITLDLVNQFGLHNYINITGIDNTIVSTTTYSDNSTSFQGIIILDDNNNFTGVIDFVEVISNIYNQTVGIVTPNHISGVAPKELLESYANTNTSLLYTIYPGYLTDNPTPLSLNNPIVNSIINYYSNLYYIGYASGGFLGFKNSLYLFAPDKYNRHNGVITLDIDNLTFSGNGFMDLTYPYVSPFKSFIYDPYFPFVEIHIEFSTNNNSIYLSSGPGSGSITVSKK